MRILMFYHSLISDWNHGNAHFLRGIATELLSRGHDVQIFEPKNAWSVQNLIAEHGHGPLLRFMKRFPHLRSHRYDLKTLNVPRITADADLIIVHEWSDPLLVQRLGRQREESDCFRLLFHDTHHRSVTDQQSMAAFDLKHYDGVLAFGNVIREIYLQKGWARQAWTWHEAADTRVFKPVDEAEKEGDLVWVGNWGDEERTAELQEFLVEPIKQLKLKARVHGVRYPESAKRSLHRAEIEYAGWLPNYQVPQAFSRFRATVHVPRRPYVQALPGIPTIRPFEALACGIPLVSSPWHDTEGMFTAGKDYLMAHSGAEMKEMLHEVMRNDSLARQLSQHGRQTILQRHTCDHRVDELLSICRQLGLKC